MSNFRYKAVDRSGTSIAGVIESRDHNEAAVKVRALGYYPVEIKSANGTEISRNGNSVAPAEKKKITRYEILLFTRELADLLDAGLPMDRALTVLIEQSDSEGLTGMIKRLQGEIRAGQPLSAALGLYSRAFPPLYANMIRAGEISGQLSTVMTQLAEFMEKEQIRRSQIIAALTYPMVLICVATLAVTFLLTFVIPKLTAVFKNLGAALPLPTQMLLAIAAVVTHYGWLIGIGIVVFVVGFRRWVQTPSGRRSFDHFRINAPLFGGLVRKIVSARYVRTLGTLLLGGVPILDSLEISSTAVGNAVMSDAVLSARSGVRQGETLSSAMEKTNQFLPIVVHMTGVGEETGKLGGMLLRTAGTLDFEVDNTMRKLTSLIEPLVVLLMGSFVGFIVLSILLPIFQADTIVK